MPEIYKNEAEYHAGCWHWTNIEKELAKAYSPNPWIFKSGIRPDPNGKRFVITFENFDGSQEINVTAAGTTAQPEIVLGQPRPAQK